MNLRRQLKTGDEVMLNGERHRVLAYKGATIHLRSSRGTPVVSDVRYLFDRGSGLRIDRSTLDEQADSAHVVTFFDNAPPDAQQRAMRFLEHLNEAATGFGSGDPDKPGPGEPKPEYDPCLTTKTERMERKAAELGFTPSHLWNQMAAYKKQGIAALVDKRTVRVVGDRVAREVHTAIRTVLAAQITESNRSLINLRRVVRLELDRMNESRGSPIATPSRATLDRLINMHAPEFGSFMPAKARRDAANRPKPTYRQVQVVRAGELVLIDTTPLDAFALDSMTYQWVQVQLTIALDLATRSIVAWRFTPLSTKGVDAALLLYDILRPKYMEADWEDRGRWPYIGIPETVVMQQLDLDASRRLAGIPILCPDAVLTDRGKIFLSQAFTDACVRLQISLRFARPYTPTDKAHVERVFLTIRQRFVEHLQGYKGPDLFSRGANPQNEAFHFLEELDDEFGNWVASYWQCRHHEGLELPSMPTAHWSPNDMYELSIATAGFVSISADERIYYELLPTLWRTIQHYGVEVMGLRYDGPALDEFRGVKSSYGGIHQGAWPIRYDPRDLSAVYFYDPTLELWHPLHRRGSTVRSRPFNNTILAYAKAKIVERGGNVRNLDELEEVLDHIIGRMDDQVLAQGKERRMAAVRAIQMQSVSTDRTRTSGKGSRQGVTLKAPDAESSVVHAQATIIASTDLDSRGTFDSSFSDPDGANEASTQGEADQAITQDNPVAPLEQGRTISDTYEHDTDFL